MKKVIEIKYLYGFLFSQNYKSGNIMNIKVYFITWLIVKHSIMYNE